MAPSPSKRCGLSFKGISGLRLLQQLWQHRHVCRNPRASFLMSIFAVTAGEQIARSQRRKLLNNDSVGVGVDMYYKGVDRYYFAHRTRQFR
jgi:hypothetical protein